jgi:glycosyltransferase involved in cell wall biosynthesis
VTKPIRVLEVIYRADRGGAETWLLHLLRHIDRSKIAIDFLVHDRKPGAYDAEITERGAKIFVCDGHRNLFRQWYGLWRLQRRHGPYDIVHSHVDYYGGLVVFLARLAGIRARIANFHTDAHDTQKLESPYRRLYVQLMKLFVKRFATGGLGVSSKSASSLFGEDWQSDRRWCVCQGSVDLLGFRARPDRDSVRAELRIPADAIIYGHVGRFVDAKNHEFLVQVAEALCARNLRARFLLVGGGALRWRTERMIEQRGLEDRFIILPPRDDIPRLMLGAMDFFLFPSLYEGLGLALVEAQAAGLRCFASTAVPTEAVAVPCLVHRLPLSAGPEFWAETIVQQIGAACPVTRDEALRRVEDSFDIRRNAAKLVEFYLAAAS